MKTNIGYVVGKVGGIDSGESEFIAKDSESIEIRQGLTKDIQSAYIFKTYNGARNFHESLIAPNDFMVYEVCLSPKHCWQW